MNDPVFETEVTGIQAPGPASAVAPRLSTAAHAPMSDGILLHYRHWPVRGARRGTLLLLHDGQEHAGRVAHLVDELQLPDVECFAWDARAHGRSPGGPAVGIDVASWRADLGDWLAHLEAAHGVSRSRSVLLATGSGAVPALSYLRDAAPALRGLVLVAPVFRRRLPRLAHGPWLGLRQALRSAPLMPSGVRAEDLTQDRARRLTWQADPLIGTRLSLRQLRAFEQQAQAVIEAAPALRVPTLMLVGGRDPLADAASQTRFFARLGAPCKQREDVAHARHEVLGEREREPALRQTRDFILKVLSERS